MPSNMNLKEGLLLVQHFEDLVTGRLNVFDVVKELIEHRAVPENCCGELLVAMETEGTFRTRTIKCLPNIFQCCEFSRFVFALFICGYCKLAFQLSLSNAAPPPRAPGPRKMACSQSGKYLAHMKMNINNGVFRDRRQFLEIKARSLWSALDKAEDVEVHSIAEKLTTVLALRIHTSADMAGRRSVLEELKRLVQRTRNPFATVVYQVKMGMTHIYTDNVEEGEVLFNIARELVWNSTASVALTYVAYGEVHRCLAEFERDPSEENETAMEDHTVRGLSIWSSKTGDLRILRFWKRIYLTKLLMCFVGLGNKMNTIAQWDRRRFNKKHVERLMGQIETESIDDIDCRSYMQEKVARARYYELTGDLESSRRCLETARNVTEGGAYTLEENRNIDVHAERVENTAEHRRLMLN